MSLILRTLILSLCLSFGFGDKLFMMHIPDGIKLKPSPNQLLENNEVSNFITYLMGFTTNWNKQLTGVSTNMFKLPKANLLINVHLPEGRNISFDDYASYQVNNKYHEAASLSDTNDAITRNYGETSLILDYEAHDQDLSLLLRHSSLLDSLPKTVRQMTKMLPDSEFKHLTKNSILDGQDATDLALFAEVQLVSDVLKKLEESLESVEDDSPDSYLFSLTALDRLANKYGAGSQQVTYAIDALKEILPQLVARFDQLYGGRLLAEVQTSGPVRHTFERVISRRRRAAGADPVAYKNRATPNDANRAVALNLGFGVAIVLAVIVLVVSYAIWFMDPGHDSVIYRMTTHRMKSD